MYTYLTIVSDCNETLPDICQFIVRFWSFFQEYLCVSFYTYLNSIPIQINYCCSYTPVIIIYDVQKI